MMKHWSGEKIDWEIIEKTALLHDLGNVVKFDLDKHPEFLGKERSNLGYWKEQQRKIIKKYGNDDHQASEKMLKEIGVSGEMIKVILEKSFGNSVMINNSNNWTAKILLYADLRTLPWGIGSLEERIADVKDRMPKYTSRPDFESLVESCRQIERDIQNNLDVGVNKIQSDIDDEWERVVCQVPKTWRGFSKS